MPGLPAFVADYSIFFGVLFVRELSFLISFEEAVDKFKQHTRNYAKRQLSWFRADKNINWFFIDEMDEGQILEGIIKLCS